MSPLWNIIQNHTNEIKYILLIVVIISMIITVRSYINYQNIILSIEKVEAQTQDIIQQKLYHQNMLLPYEQTDLAKYFLGHENNILFPGEFIIRFQQQNNTSIKTENKNKSNNDTISQPQQARQHYLRNIFTPQNK